MATLPQNLRPNANLTNFAIAHSQTKDMRALMVPGIVPVTQQSDRYLIWDKGDLLRAEMEERADGTEAAEANARVSSDTYYARNYALKRKLTEKMIDEAGSLQAAEDEVARYLTEQAYLTIARQFVARLFVSTVWGTGVGGIANQTGAATAGSNQFIQWDRPTGDPIGDIARASRLIKTSIGRKPTDLITGDKVFDDACNNADIVERLKHTSGDPTTEQILAKLFKLSGGVYPIAATQNAAAEGQTASMAQIAGLSALLGHFSATPTMGSPSAAKVFAFQKYGGYPATVPTIRKWFQESTKTFWYEAEIYFDIKVTAPDAAVFFITPVQAEA